MSVSLFELSRRMLRRPTQQSPPDSLRTRLALTPLEDRVVPALVSVEPATVNDAAEGGTDGVFRFSRTGGTTNALTVNYTVGGTATSGTDYTALTGTVTFAAGSATADVAVHAFHDGINDPDETVVVTVDTGIGYVVGTTSTATVTTIDTDILPFAFDGWMTTSQNAALNVPVLDLAVSPYGDALAASAVTQPADGTAVLNGNGTVTYTPDTGFVGDDSFTYTVEDPFGNEATGTVTISVTGVQAAPTSLWTATNAAVAITLTDLAFDPDGDTLTATGVTQGDHGTVSLSNGVATYTPANGYTGDDSFDYTVEDDDGNEATHTITVTVGPIDPVAIDDDATTGTNTAVTFTVPDLAVQPAGGSMTVTAVTQGANGSVTINGNGTVTYTPNTSFTGTDTFTYTVTDSSSRTDTGTITVQVGPVAPTVTDEIVAALADMEDALDNYDEGTPDAIAAALPDTLDAIADYLTETTTYISTFDFGTTGANKSVRELAPFAGRPAGVLYGKLSNLLAQLSALSNAMIANKTAIKNLETALAAARNANPPVPAAIAALQAQITTLNQVQAQLIRQYENIYDLARDAHDEAMKLYKAVAPTVPARLPAPPSLPAYDLGPFIPK